MRGANPRTLVSLVFPLADLRPLLAADTTTPLKAVARAASYASSDFAWPASD